QGRLFTPEEHPVGEEDRSAARIGVEALGDVLEERVVCTSLWGHAPHVATVRVLGERSAVPRLDGVGRVCQHDVERLEMTLAVEERRSAQGDAVGDVAVCDAV